MDRITHLHIHNVRAFESVIVRIGATTVLIGENGSGKSTVLECLEIMRKAAEPNFEERFHHVHGGLSTLRRIGAADMTIGVTLQPDDPALPPLRYTLRFGDDPLITSETITALHPDGRESNSLLRRASGKAHLYFDALGEVQTSPVRPGETYLGQFGDIEGHEHIKSVASALRGLRIQVGFDVSAGWIARSTRTTQSIREPSLLNPAGHLALQGRNLANAWFTLRQRKPLDWQRTLATLQLGLGTDFEDVTVSAVAGGAHIGLGLRRRDLEQPIPAAALSDGQLSWLAFVALAELDEARSLLAIDEPEKHLHPGLLGRVMMVLGDLHDGAPVLLSTHSDRLLSMLRDPADSVRVCALDGSRAVVHEVDREALDAWLVDYGDMGVLRERGFLSHVLADERQGSSKAS